MSINLEDIAVGDTLTVNYKGEKIDIDVEGVTDSGVQATVDGKGIEVPADDIVGYADESNSSSTGDSDAGSESASDVDSEKDDSTSECKTGKMKKGKKKCESVEDVNVGDTVTAVIGSISFPDLKVTEKDQYKVIVSIEGIEYGVPYSNITITSQTADTTGVASVSDDKSENTLNRLKTVIGRFLGKLESTELELHDFPGLHNNAVIKVTDMDGKIIFNNFLIKTVATNPNSGLIQITGTDQTTGDITTDPYALDPDKVKVYTIY